MEFFRHRRFDASPIPELVAVLFGVGAAFFVAASGSGRLPTASLPVFETQEAARSLTRLTYVDDSEAADHLSHYLGETLTPEQVTSTVGKNFSTENYDELEFETWIAPGLAKQLADQVLVRAEAESERGGRILVPNRSGQWAFTILELPASDPAVIRWHWDKYDYGFEINRSTGLVKCFEIYDD